MKQFESFLVLGQETNVCKLLKSFYGLKQAPKQVAWEIWSNNIKQWFFFYSSSYMCIYNFFYTNYLIICLYVDDMLLFTTNVELALKIMRFLASKFEIKDLGGWKFYIRC